MVIVDPAVVDTGDCVLEVGSIVIGTGVCVPDVVINAINEMQF